MGKSLTSQRHPVADLEEAMELPHRKGWTDGLPVVPPTEDRVAQFLDYVGLEPDRVIGEVPERGRIITAEKVAVNTVMAGCLPEYMPVVIASVEAMTDPQFKFNHLASLGSPWPIIIVSGPITREIGLNSSYYILGPGSRPNATIARAVSLVFSNCAEAKIGGIQRGQMGNAIRWGGCIAENEDTSWTALHVQRGFDRNTSAVTVVSTYPGSPLDVHIWMLGERPARMLDSVCNILSHGTGAGWSKGVYVLIIPPHMVDIFIREGWSKEDARNYLLENTRCSIADLKYRGVWGFAYPNFTEEMQRIQPGDEKIILHLFKENGAEHDQYLFTRSHTEGRLVDVFIVVAGGNAGPRMGLTFPYQQATNPVTKAVKPRRMEGIGR